MFILFPKKKPVDKIVEDANLAPPWQWTPTQTLSMLQAQNELIEQFLKENHDLKIKNQKLKAELDKWEKDWDEQNKNVSELTKEMLQLRHLKEENVQLMERVNEIDNDVIRDLQDEILVRKNDYAVLKAQKHPMHPLQWSDISNALQKAKDLKDNVKVDLDKSLNEQCDEVKKSQNWSTLKVAMQDAVQAKLGELPKTFPNEFQDAYTECGITGYKIPKEKSWEETASDLALRVVKLEKQVEELKLIKI